VSLSLSYVSWLAAEHRGAQLELGDPAFDDEEIGGEDGGVTGEATCHEEANGEEIGGEDSGVGEERPGSGGDDPAAAFNPPPVLPDGVRGRYMGLALYYPALAAVGLLEVARSLFRLPRSERFGVRATVITLFFMTLLSRTTLEAAKHLRRGEFGTNSRIGAGAVREDAAP
jgi:hypothetical protein